MSSEIASKMGAKSGWNGIGRRPRPSVPWYSPCVDAGRSRASPPAPQCGGATRSSVCRCPISIRTITQSPRLLGERQRATGDGGQESGHAVTRKSDHSGHTPDDQPNDQHHHRHQQKDSPTKPAQRHRRETTDRRPTHAPSTRPGAVKRPDALARLAREQLGYEHFHPGQEEAIRAVAEGCDTLAVMPTGSAHGLGQVGYLPTKRVLRSLARSVRRDSGAKNMPNLWLGA